jgi:hypothetical protein
MREDRILNDQREAGLMTVCQAGGIAEARPGQSTGPGSLEQFEIRRGFGIPSHQGELTLRGFGFKSRRHEIFLSVSIGDPLACGWMKPKAWFTSRSLA